MAPSSRRLVKFGFLSQKGLQANRSMSKEEWEEAIEKKSDEELEMWADHHQIETSFFHQVMNSSYPKPMNEYYLSYESFSRPLESYYFWAINHLNDLGYARVEKITDIFAASEQSAMYGSSAQRLGLAQDKVSSFMMSIGRLIKDLFAMVREVRVMDERLDYYNEAMGDDLKVKDTAEIALKS